MNAPAPVLSRGVRRWLAGLAVLFVATVAVAFVLLPAVQPDYRSAGWWQSLCRAAGVPAEWVAPADAQDAKASRVSLVPALSRADGGDVGHGGTLALRCTMCHGARGVSSSDIPNLAGQYAEVTYKQLLDYRHGQRQHALMQALAVTLSDQDIRNLAAFYAQLPRPSPNPEHAPAPAPALVEVGAPLRNIAPCASCHGGVDQKPGSPWLEGMPRAYLVTQLEALAQGTRRNDAHGVMRNVAREMTAQEIQEAATYYASRRVPYSAGGEAPAR